VLQTKHGPAHSASTGQQHSRLLRIQKSVDDAKNAANIIDENGMTLSQSVEVLSEIDNLKDIDALVEIGQNMARDHKEDLQDFVRHSLLCE